MAPSLNARLPARPRSHSPSSRGHQNNPVRRPSPPAGKCKWSPFLISFTFSLPSLLPDMGPSVGRSVGRTVGFRFQPSFPFLSFFLFPACSRSSLTHCLFPLALPVAKASERSPSLSQPPSLRRTVRPDAARSAFLGPVNLIYGRQLKDSFLPLPPSGSSSSSKSRSASQLSFGQAKPGCQSVSSWR